MNKREAFELPLADVTSSTVTAKTDVAVVLQQPEGKRSDELLVRNQRRGQRAPA